MTDFTRTIRGLNLTAVSFAISVAALGHALQISSGTFHPDALWWVGVAFVCCMVGALTHRLSDGWTSIGVRTVAWLLAGGVLWNVKQHLTATPGIFIDSSTSLLPFYAGIVAETVLLVLGVLEVKFAARWWFAGVLLVNLLLGIWLFKAVPDPYIDVGVVHKEALGALLQGKDPYRISFPNIYGEDSKYFYNPEVVMGDRIAFGYPYPPPSLLLAVPGYVLFGDYRYSELLFLLATAALIGYSRKHIVAPLAAMTLLTTPRGFFVLEQGWTEPIAIFLVALTTCLLIRGPRKASWAAGLMLATKQYLPFTGLAVLRSLWLDRRRWTVTLGIIVAVGAVCILPFAFWHTNSFMRSVVWLQTLEPFRTDSLSFLVWADRNGFGRGSFLWAIGAAIVAALLSLLTTRNTPSGFATSAAIIMFAMFALGSKAFCNYYYFVIGAMCCAIGAFAGPGEQDVTVD